MRRFLTTRPARRARIATFAFTLAAIVLRAAPALAGDEAAAEALFLEAKKLAAEGKLAEACPKFAESNRLDRGAGTLIHLADCYEKNHQTASAWASFRDAASAAQGLGRADWEKLATSRAAALEPKLARLTIKVVEPAEGIAVTRDGSPTSQASWSVPIPVDVGNHVVVASAPGRKTFKTNVAVRADGDRAELVVPKLEPGATSGVTTTPTAGGESDSGPHGSSQRTIGFVVGGIGVVGIAVGAVTGLVAMGKNNDSKKACPNDGACASSDAVDANSSARTFGTVSTIGFIAGGVGVVAGALLIFTATSSSSTSAASAARMNKGVRVLPDTDGRSAGMTFLGVF
ncbi:MAG: hypothetical protein QOI41_1990 [Myxococcales bacterium]|jgi:hypothetical protein|nr:hypothetical protein [Myxococcales bacterium]